jgi:hypothetical protein
MHEAEVQIKIAGLVLGLIRMWIKKLPLMVKVFTIIYYIHTNFS